jgi:muconolactone delta-isomerase
MVQGGGKRRMGVMIAPFPLCAESDRQSRAASALFAVSAVWCSRSRLEQCNHATEMNRAIAAPRRMPMKYMLSWSERPQGSPMEYENAQKRILEVFTQWKAPDNFKIELFVIRVGDWGGYMLLDCDDPLAVHKFCSMLPAFVFEARPVVPVMDAVRVELEAIAFRDGLKRP